ncbi:MAG: transporter substrate-binding domain-containing protein, partial [Prevotellaceae bacterium]|nr:transporter substrate-binding domain-containing protein [Prevotellaceae bacterium]
MTGGAGTGWNGLTRKAGGLLLLLVVLLCCLYGCRKARGHAGEQACEDLPEIMERGELVVLTLSGSTSYFNYRGQEMGFQYELAEQFARSLGLRLHVKVARNVTELKDRLLAGKGDLIAYNLPVTKEWKDSLRYCGEEFVTHQVIVQQAGGRVKPMEDVTALVGKDVYVKPGKYYDRLVNLDEELGGGILIHPVADDSVTVEDLITQVSQGVIPYTVADNDLARLNATYYNNLNTGLSISLDQRASWAVRKNAHKLAEAADKWFEENKTSPAYTASTKRYFEISKTITHSP